MTGKRPGERDKEGVTAPLHANDPVGPHTHLMTSPVRLASSYTPHYVEIHARRRRHHLNLVVKNMGTLEMPGK